MDREWFLTVDPRPLQKRILKLLWIPAELSLRQQIIGACVMAVVLQDELLPRQGELICPRVGQELLPFVWWKGCTMHYVVIDVDLLDAKVYERKTKRPRDRPV